MAKRNGTTRATGTSSTSGASSMIKGIRSQIAAWRKGRDEYLSQMAETDPMYRWAKLSYEEAEKELQAFEKAASKFKVGDYVEAPTTSGLGRGTITEIRTDASEKGYVNPSTIIYVDFDRSIPRISSFTGGHVIWRDYDKIKKVNK